MHRSSLLILLPGLLVSFGPPAWADTDCVRLCRSDYQSTRWPSDQRMCTRTSAYGRCVEETLQNVKIYCAQRCEDNPRAYSQNPSQGLQLTPDSQERLREGMREQMDRYQQEPRRRGTPSGQGGIRN